MNLKINIMSHHLYSIKQNPLNQISLPDTNYQQESPLLLHSPSYLQGYQHLKPPLLKPRTAQRQTMPVLTLLLLLVQQLYANVNHPDQNHVH